MFIVARPVKGRYIWDNTKLLVYDLEDLTLEYVDNKQFTSLISPCGEVSGVEVVGAIRHGDECSYDRKYSCLVDRLERLNYVNKDGYVAYGSGLVAYCHTQWRFCNYTVDLWYDYPYFVVNGTRINGCGDFIGYYRSSPHYAFEYERNLVIRFIQQLQLSNGDFDYIGFTVIVNRYGRVECAYKIIKDTPIFLYGDKGLMVRVELLFSY